MKYKQIIEKLEYMLFAFFIVSIVAWLLEMLFSLIFRSKFVLPGVLYGPWCPIYGVTFIFLYLFINKKDKKIHNIFKIFMVASVIEYVASFISEVFFNRIIWDYSKYLFNINGRICLHMTLLFTFLGYILFYYIEPLLNKIYNKLGREVTIINIELFLLFIFDISLKIISNM